jgi:hypothetical protein
MATQILCIIGEAQPSVLTPSPIVARGKQQSATQKLLAMPA